MILNAEAEGCAAAVNFRRDHRLGAQPLGDLVTVIEQTTGTDVTVLDADPDEHGLTMRDPARNVVLIAIARTRNPMRQRSTLAHELGHVIFGDWAGGCSNNWSARRPVEIRADAFARHLLLPREGLMEFLGKDAVVSERELSAVVQRFLVSPAVAAIAMHQAGCIGDSTKRAWMMLTAPRVAARFGWGDQYRALQADSDLARAPQRLLARAIKGYSEGVLPAQAIATLRGVSLRTAEEDLREAGVAPVIRAVRWADPNELPEPNVDLVALDTDLNAAGGSAQDVSAEIEGA